MKHAVSETDMSSLASSSSSSPIHLKHYPYTVRSPCTESQDGDKSSVQSSSTQPYSSNPLGSPSRPLYSVQSPSTESRDGDKSSRHSSSNQAYSNTAMTFPSRPSLAFSSSGSRISGRYMPPSRVNRNWNRYEKGWNQCYVIVEEEEHYDGNDRWQWLLGFLLAFSVVCLIIWGVTRPYRPRVAVESLAVNNFYFGEGSDFTGVPTKLLTVNCTVNMTIHNPASCFGIQVSSTPVDLFYLDITVATGQMKSYYQPRESKRIVSLNIEGNKIPLYGAGSSLAVSFGQGGVPLRLGFDIRSQADVVGKLVKKKHRRHISCTLVINSSNTGAIRFKEDSCRYN